MALKTSLLGKYILLKCLVSMLVRAEHIVGEELKTRRVNATAYEHEVTLLQFWGGNTLLRQNRIYKKCDILYLTLHEVQTVRSSELRLQWAGDRSFFNLMDIRNLKTGNFTGNWLRQ